MNKTALIFSGQGSQYVGMGKDICDQYKSAKDIFSKADKVIGKDISKICFNGSKEKLNQTIYTQPAVFTYNLAVYSLFSRYKFDFIAGHSLGEVCAAVASKAVNLENGLDIVRKRANLMQKAAEKENGSMIAVIGLELGKIKNIIKSIKGVYLSNFNSYLQTTISGSKKGLDEAKLALKGKARLVIDLDVSGAFHSPFMNEAKKSFGKYLEMKKFKNPQTPVVANYDAKPKLTANTIKSSLVKQVTAPVQFVRMLEFLDNEGVDTFLEIGPGKIITNLIKRTLKKAKVFSTESIDSIELSLNNLLNG